MPPTLAPAAHEVIGHVGARTQALLLAHQGGWDEILMVLVPVALFAALLYVANQRAGKLAGRDGEPPTGDGDEGSGTGTDPGVTRPRPVPRNDRSGPI